MPVDNAVAHLPLRLKLLRIAAEITQAELAEALGVSTNAVSAWEQGIALPNAERLLRLARFYDTSIDHLFGRAPGPLDGAAIPGEVVA